MATASGSYHQAREPSLLLRATYRERQASAVVNAAQNALSCLAATGS